MINHVICIYLERKGEKLVLEKRFNVPTLLRKGDRLRFCASNGDEHSFLIDDQEFDIQENCNYVDCTSGVQSTEDADPVRGFVALGWELATVLT